MNTKESEALSFAVKSNLALNATNDMSSLETPNLNNAPSIGNFDRPELSLPSIRRGAPLPAKQEPAAVKRQKQVA